MVTARQGVDPAAEPVTVPQDVLALRNVRTLPQALAAFLVALALAALGHALVTAVRRRRHDLAVLRALGFPPRQNAACIAWQATTVAVVGLVLGLPLGVVVGRLSWRWVADSTPLLYVPPVAARRAARLRPAEVLRSEEGVTSVGGSWRQWCRRRGPGPPLVRRILCAQPVNCASSSATVATGVRQAKPSQT